MENVIIARGRLYIQAPEPYEDCDLLLTLQMPLDSWGVDELPAQNECKPTPSILDRLPFTFPYYLTGQPASSHC